SLSPFSSRTPSGSGLSSVAGSRNAYQSRRGPPLGPPPRERAYHKIVEGAANAERLQVRETREIFITIPFLELPRLGCHDDPWSLETLSVRQPPTPQYSVVSLAAPSSPSLQPQGGAYGWFIT